MQALMEAQQPQYDNVANEIQVAFNRTSVKNADDIGLKIYESVLNINAKADETLSYRKDRVIYKLSTMPPFSYNFLRTQLDKIFGSENYTCEVNFAEYELVIKAVASDANYFLELSKIIRWIKPANMLYIYQPLITQGMLVNETVYADIAQWAYNLGDWKLGQYPFIKSELEVYKMPATLSITQALLNKNAEAALAQIAKAVLNGTIEVLATSFVLAEASNGVVAIEFMVPDTNGAPVTSCEIKTADGTVLSSSEFNVPAGESTRFRIVWTYLEGV